MIKHGDILASQGSRSREGYDAWFKIYRYRAIIKRTRKTTELHENILLFF